MAGWLADESTSQEGNLATSEEAANRYSALVESLSALNTHEPRLFEVRRLADESLTLEERAKEFGVSRERVRQIEVRAFEKVQRARRSHDRPARSADASS